MRFMSFTARGSSRRRSSESCRPRRRRLMCTRGFRNARLAGGHISFEVAGPEPRLPWRRRARCYPPGRGIGRRRTTDRRPRRPKGSSAPGTARDRDAGNAGRGCRKRIVESSRSRRALEGNDVSSIAASLRSLVEEIREGLSDGTGGAERPSEAAARWENDRSKGRRVPEASERRESRPQPASSCDECLSRTNACLERSGLRGV